MMTRVPPWITWSCRESDLSSGTGHLIYNSYRDTAQFGDSLNAVGTASTTRPGPVAVLHGDGHRRHAVGQCDRAHRLAPSTPIFHTFVLSQASRAEATRRHYALDGGRVLIKLCSGPFQQAYERCELIPTEKDLHVTTGPQGQCEPDDLALDAYCDECVITRVLVDKLHARDRCHSSPSYGVVELGIESLGNAALMGRRRHWQTQQTAWHCCRHHET